MSYYATTQFFIFQRSHFEDLSWQWQMNGILLYFLTDCIREPTKTKLTWRYVFTVVIILIYYYFWSVALSGKVILVSAEMLVPVTNHNMWRFRLELKDFVVELSPRFVDASITDSFNQPPVFVLSPQTKRGYRKGRCCRPGRGVWQGVIPWCSLSLNAPRKDWFEQTRVGS